MILGLREAMREWWRRFRWRRQQHHRWRRKEICHDDLRELGGTGSSIQAMVVFGDDW